MVYIYDIVLNFSDDLIEFFEWEDNDDVKYIKKLPLIRVEDKLIKDILGNNIVFDDKLMERVKGKTIYYDKSEKNYPVIVLSNQDMVIAVQLIDNNKLKYSRLLLDEEYEVMSIASKVSITKVDYTVVSKRTAFNNLTRKEKEIRNLLLNEIDCLYNNNKIDKLNYYYYEYFNELNNNKEEMYKRLKDTFNVLNNKHLKLLEIVKLTNK